MTEVRLRHKDRSEDQTSSHGLFATQKYVAGDVILVESSPLLQLSPSILSNVERQWMDSIVKNLNQASRLDPKTSADSSGEIELQRHYTKFNALVQVALCFVLHVASSSSKSLTSWLDDPMIEDLRQLYHPPLSISEQTSEHERTIVALSLEAFQCVETSLRNNTSWNLDNSTSGTNHVTHQQLIQAMNILSVQNTDSSSSATESVRKDWQLHPIVQEVMLWYGHVIRFMVDVFIAHSVVSTIPAIQMRS
jgi:hypothetical protein